MKIKEIETINKCLDFARKLYKNLWNMRETIIPIRAFGTVLKVLAKKVLAELEIRR